jgi:hypothetical protein
VISSDYISYAAACILNHRDHTNPDRKHFSQTDSKDLTYTDTIMPDNNKGVTGAVTGVTGTVSY